MKRLCSLLLLLALLVSLCACQRTALDEGASGSVCFIYGDKNINSSLSSTDLAAIKEMFDGKSLYADNPSCGFSDKIAVKIGKDVFCLAADDCPTVYYKNENKFFSLSLAENVALKDILAKYGFTFPCA